MKSVLPSGTETQAAPPEGSSPPRERVRGAVAYIAHYFPALTQTFVYREVRALRIYEGTSEIQKLIIAGQVYRT